MGTRAAKLASRLLEGAEALAAYAERLDENQWATTVPHDGRTVGVVVHHVASVYPVEVELAQVLAAGKPIVDVTAGVIDEMNAGHATAHAKPVRDATVALLRASAKAAAAAVSQFTDAQLDAAAQVSLYANAPLTAQFFIEDHALRHSFHHLQRIRAALAS